MSPYILLCSPEKSISGLRDSAEVVIELQKIKIQFDYPLEKPVTFDYDADTLNGFTRKHLAECIVSGYRKIYEEEEAFVASQSGPERDPQQVTMLNRESKLLKELKGLKANFHQQLMVRMAFGDIQSEILRCQKSFKCKTTFFH